VPRSKVIGSVLALALLVVLLVVAGRSGLLDSGVQAAPASRSTPAARAGEPERDPGSGLPFVELAALPAEARRTVALIDRGGPFPYAKDGVTFGNRERVLPARPGGYYREYTVPTPGERDRGARRIVTGDHDREFFYTSDHYTSFARIRR
jgi:ribonuclease T1